ncbi:MAG: hypothetical protein ABEJ69_01985 [Candidatus Nanohaloarchaea archaeon]
MSYAREEVLEVYGTGYSAREELAPEWVWLEELFGIEDIDSEIEMLEPPREHTRDTIP